MAEVGRVVQNPRDIYYYMKTWEIVINSLFVFQLAVASTITEKLVIHVCKLCVEELDNFSRTYKGNHCQDHNCISIGLMSILKIA